jgi:CheY-like chemotaxis protein
MSDASYKVMVVEDNDFVRMQISSFLKGEGLDVIECSDGLEATGKISQDISIAIVDVRMEPVNGFEFIRKIRNDGIKTPVILVTGDDNPDLLNEVSRLNVLAVLKKPVQKDRLIKIVFRALHMEKS